MIAALLIAQPHYGAVEIRLPEKAMGASAILTADGTVAGYWYHMIGHGAGEFTTPFVWSKGMLTSLPTGIAEYGQVRAGISDLLVGGISSPKGWEAVAWKPDASKGWAKPFPTKLGIPGICMAIGPDRKIWIRIPDGLASWTNGKIERWKQEKFDLVGVDEKGRLFGNTYEGLGPGFSRSRQQAVVGRPGHWTKLHPKGSWSRLVAVNRKGLAVGSSYDNRSGAFRWDGGGISLLGEDENSSTPQAINNGGDIAGSITKGSEWRASLWVKGKRVDISGVVPGQRLNEAVGINDKGQVLASASGEPTRFYLLTPKGR